MVKMYRQGDLLFMEVDSIPKIAKLVDSTIILRGEATGHAHRIENGQVFRTWDQTFLKADQGAKVVHDEHGPIELDAGVYVVIRQREYDPDVVERSRHIED
jgi:hypothetical protein